MKDNQIAHFRRNKEGYKNPEDVHYFYSEREKRIDRLRTAVEYLRQILRLFASIEPVDVQDKRVFGSLEKQRLLEPRLVLYTGIRARSWLKKNGLYSRRQTPPYAIAVFNFPKPVAKNWNVGWIPQEQYEEYKRGLRKTKQTPWANLYGVQLRTLWNVIAAVEYGLDEESYEYQKKLGIDVELVNAAYEMFQTVGKFGVRINNSREHDEDNFYNVWGWYE